MIRENKNPPAPVKDIFSWPGWLLLALGTFLRAYGLGARSLWLDEAYSLALAALPLPKIIAGAAMDIHPPLFHILLAGWIKLFGSSEVALRSLSVVFGVLLIPAVYYLVQAWANSRAAWLAAILVCGSPYFVELSRSGRMPAALALGSALSLLCFWKVLHSGKPVHSLGYILVSLAMVYTHYFGWLTVFSQQVFVFAGIGKLNLPKQIRKIWLVLQLLLILGFAPWFPYFWEQLQRGGPGWRGVGAAWYEPLHSLYALLAGSACWTWWHKGAFLICLAVGAGLGVWWCWQQRQACLAWVPQRTRLLLVLMVLVPLASVFIYSQVKVNVFDNRYLSLSALGLLAGLSVLLAALPALRQRLALACVLLGFSVPVSSQLLDNRYSDHWQEAGAWMQTHAIPGDWVAVYPAWNQTPLAYYVHKQFHIQGIPGNYDPISGITENYFSVDRAHLSRVEAIFAGHDQPWLVLVNAGAEQSVVEEWCREKFSLSAEWHQGSIHILGLRRKNRP